MIPKPPGWPRSPSLRLLPNLLCLQVSNPSTEAVHPPATPRARQSDQRCGRPCVYPGGTTRGRKRALRLRRLFFFKWLPGSLGTRAVVPRRGAEWCLTHWDGCRTEDGAARPRPGRNLQAAQEYGSQQGAGRGRSPPWGLGSSWSEQRALQGWRVLRPRAAWPRRGRTARRAVGTGSAAVPLMEASPLTVDGGSRRGPGTSLTSFWDAQGPDVRPCRGVPGRPEVLTPPAGS